MVNGKPEGGHARGAGPQRHGERERVAAGGGAEHGGRVRQGVVVVLLPEGHRPDQQQRQQGGRLPGPGAGPPPPLLSWAIPGGVLRCLPRPTVTTQEIEETPPPPFPCPATGRLVAGQGWKGTLGWQVASYLFDHFWPFFADLATFECLSKRLQSLTKCLATFRKFSILRQFLAILDNLKPFFGAVGLFLRFKPFHCRLYHFFGHFCTTLFKKASFLSCIYS